MNASHLWGCRCAFGPAETFDVVRFFLLISHGEGSAYNFLSTPFICWSHVSIFFLLALLPNMPLIFLSSLFFPFIYSRSCTFAPHKANKVHLPFSSFFFVYLFCLSLSSPLSRQSKESRSHTKSQILSHLSVCAS